MFEFRTEWMYEYFNLISDSRVATSLLAVLLGVVLLSAHRHADAWIKWIGSSALLYGVGCLKSEVQHLAPPVRCDDD